MMNEGKKRILTVLFDIVLVALVVAAVYFYLFGDVSSGIKKLLTAVIVISIPTIFVISFITFSGNKYDFEIPEDEDEAC